MNLKTTMKLKGHVEILVYQGGTLIDRFEDYNIILKDGIDNDLRALWSNSHLIIKRIAIGDRGTIPSSTLVPKVPERTRHTLYNEIFRKDVDAINENLTDETVRFTVTVDASEIPITAYSDQSNPGVSEVMLIMADALGGDPFPRTVVIAPATPPTDEAGFGMRCFKKVPFEASTGISVTIRYTIKKE